MVGYKIGHRCCHHNIESRSSIDIFLFLKIIVAKPAGGPKMPEKGHWDNDD